MTAYEITTWTNPGIYGKDAQGNLWTTFTCNNHTVTCDECGAEIAGGYVRGRWGETNLRVCCSHIKETRMDNTAPDDS